MSFYIGVCDIEYFEGTKDHLHEARPVDRYFGDKFVDSPETALLNILDEVCEPCKSRWKLTKEEFEKHFTDFTYNPETNEYCGVFYYTDNGHIPSEYQMKKFEENEYTFQVEKIYIQILKTDLIKDNFLEKAKKSFIKLRWPK